VLVNPGFQAAVTFPNGNNPAFGAPYLNYGNGSYIYYHDSNPVPATAVAPNTPQTFNGWTYDGTGGAGVAVNGGAFGTLNGGAGNQFAFLQGSPTISQSFTLATQSLVDLSYIFQGRSNNGGVGVLTATIDGLPVVGLPPLGITQTNGTAGNPNASATFTEQTAVLSGGLHTLQFSFVGAPGDNSAYLDAVTLDATAVPEINPGSATVPFLLIIASLCLLPSRRRKED